ncbi:MAG: glycosyl hydrolase [candidate division Zixibacteria bacterium]|nr:glycosyl hydrolase [candidate division Zixibacteria bacterium]
MVRLPFLKLVVFISLCAVLSAPTFANDDPAIGSYIFGDIRARAIGPAVMGGRIAALDAVNDDPAIIYVGAASGGIWKSINAGTTFDPIFDEYTQSIGAIAIDQNHPDTVWVGTGEPWVRNSVSVGTGIYKTIDGGETWQLMGLDDTERIGKIVIHPRGSDTVYVAALGHLWDANEQRGLFKTTDGGESWEKILYVDENTGCVDIAIDPQEPDIIYAAMWEFRRTPHSFNSGGSGSGLYKSEDGGETWKELTGGLPAGDLGRIAIAVAPSRPSVIYANVESDTTALYRSDDFGQSWKKMSSSFNIKMRPFYFSLLVPDPEDHNRIYKPGLLLSASKDGGESFSMVAAQSVHSDHHALWINPSNPEHLILGTDGGIYVSFDRGNSWRFLKNLPISQFYHVSCDNQTPYNLYGGLQDNGSWYGPSRSPGGIENSDWENIGFGDGFYVLVDAADDDIIYFEYQGGRIFRYHRSISEMKDIRPLPDSDDIEYRFNWNTPIALSPNNPNKLYIGAQYLLCSYDKGESWIQLSGDLTTDDPDKQEQEESGGLTIDNTTAENHCTIYTIAESPLDSGIIWVGTDDGNVQITENGGKSWRNVVDNIDDLPEHTWCSYIEAGNFDKQTAYATFDGHRTGDMRTYLYKTSDLGNSWQRLYDDSLDGYAHVIKEDIISPNLLYLGTEFGLFVSIDRGLRWIRFSQNLPQVAVRDIAIHPSQPDLILGTHGRGIYIVDDISPIRQLNSVVLASDVHLFESIPASFRTPIYKQHFPGNGEFVGGNPSEVAFIDYYLKKRHLFGDLSVEIYNSEGDLIKALPGGKRKGINRVKWYMRRKPPKVARSATLGMGVFGPAAPEGTYSYNLNKGKSSFSGSLELVSDPTSPHSLDDRQLQQKTVMELYDMQESLAYIAEAISDAREQAEERIEQVSRNKRLKGDLEDFSEELYRLYETLVVAEHKQGITGEEQLREKVVDLYSSVNMYGGKPTESQLALVPVYRQQIAEAEDEFNNIIDTELNRLNAKLEKNKILSIELLSREEFLTED